MASRQHIFKQIDDLDNVRNIQELVAGLKPILNKIAYYIVAGDAGVMEYTEEWHTAYTDALHEASAKEAPPPGHAPSSGKQPSGRHPSERHSSERQPSGRQSSERHSSERQQPSGRQSSSERQPHKVARPPRSNIPDSLRRIMEGTHESLRKNDDSD